MSRRNDNIEIVECDVGDNNIAPEMTRMGLSQEKTARRAGMTHRQLTRILKNRCTPSLRSAIALSVVLGKPIDKLFEFKVRTREAVPEPEPE